MATKRPAFQFYPGDWLRDTALRSCSVSARGLWIDMIALMHDAEPYGNLAVNFKKIDAKTLARMVGATRLEVVGWLKELEVAGVCSRTEDGMLYSRRMVRDEQVRAARAAGGVLGGNPALKDSPKVGDKVNLPPNLQPTPAVAVAVSSAEQQEQHSVLSSESTGAGRRPTSPNGGEKQPASPEPTFGDLMGMARKQGFEADATDASIMQALIRKRVKPHDIAIVLEGFPLLVKSGGYPVPAGQKLNMKMLYSSDHGKTMPAWRRAEDAYIAADNAKKPVGMGSF